MRIGGIVERDGASRRPDPLNGGPQMVEVSRDGRRVYLTNSLYASWDEQFYPEGMAGWMTKWTSTPPAGSPSIPSFLVDFGSRRPHQVRLAGRRRLLGLVLLPVEPRPWPWLTLALLGA